MRENTRSPNKVPSSKREAGVPVVLLRSDVLKQKSDTVVQENTRNVN